MQSETAEPKTVEAQAAVIPPPGAPQQDRGPRVTAQMLVEMAPSDRRDNWIAQLVEVEVARQNYSQDKALARDFALSGQFDDLKDMKSEQAIATAMVKIQLGRGWGFNAADSMRSIYFTNGKPSVENEMIASKLQQAGFDWDTEWIEDEVQHKGRPAKKCVGCTLWLKRLDKAEQHFKPVLDRNGNPVSVSFTQYDADTAQVWEKGKQMPLSEKWNFKSWGRDMYYWRCIARVKKYHAPNVLRGGVSRDEALEMIPVENMPPVMLPKELQPPQPEGPPAEAPEPRTKLRDVVMNQPSFAKGPGEPEKPPEEDKW